MRLKHMNQIETIYLSYGVKGQSEVIYGHMR